MKTDDDLVLAGQRAVTEGMRLWNLDVGDPAPQFLVDPHPGADAKWMTLHERAVRWRKVIDEILSACNQPTPYKGNHTGFEWCGATAEDLWIKAGINPARVRGFFESTHRLYAWAHYRDFLQHKNVPEPKAGEPRRLVARLGPKSTVKDLPFEVREGDIGIIGGPHDKPGLEVVGRHIWIARGVDLKRGVILTVEGNGWGKAPGTQPDREGIVLGERHIGGAGDHVMWLYRPAPDDLL